MVEIAQGETWWADLPEPAGSGPGFRRPVVVVQGDHLSRSRIATVVCVPRTSNLTWADAPGNVLLSATLTGLPKDSVANASQVVALDRQCLSARVGETAEQEAGPRDERDRGGSRTVSQKRRRQQLQLMRTIGTAGG